MKKIILTILVIISITGFSQSYVFCPDLQGTTEKARFTDNPISIVFRDSRVYDKKLKEKCTKSEIFAEMVNGLRQTYPKAKFAIMDESKFDEEPQNGVITIKLTLQKYDATFYTGMYISHTKYEVKIFDNRNGNNVITEVVEGEGEQWNSIGFTSGKLASKTSFKAAFEKFSSALEQLPEVSVDQLKPSSSTLPKSNTTKSKADRLRELKQLLDEKILTQEEYDKEKKKILDEEK